MFLLEYSINHNNRTSVEHNFFTFFFQALRAQTKDPIFFSRVFKWYVGSGGSHPLGNLCVLWDL